MRALRLATALAAVAASAAQATPFDAVDDFLRAVESADAGALLGTLSTSLVQTLEARWEDVRALFEEDPGAGGAVVARIIPYINPEDVVRLSLEQVLALVLPAVDLGGHGPETAMRTEARLRGAQAEVVYTWPDGESARFSLVFEEGTWRISGSGMLDGILGDLF
jgi:hypothetical protein